MLNVCGADDWKVLGFKKSASTYNLLLNVSYTSKSITERGNLKRGLFLAFRDTPKA